MRWFAPLVRIILFRLVALKFALGVVVGMAFSMAVILSTMGLMDGFENALKEGLKKARETFPFPKGGGFFYGKMKFKKFLSGRK